MPFILMIIGAIIITAGFQDTYKELGKQVAGDFTGENNFTYWLISLGVVGAIGYFGEGSQLRTFSRVFMALIIIALIVGKNGGVKIFEMLQQGIAEGTKQEVTVIGSPIKGSGSGGGGGDSGIDAGTIISIGASFL